MSRERAINPWRLLCLCGLALGIAGCAEASARPDAVSQLVEFQKLPRAIPETFYSQVLGGFRLVNFQRKVHDGGYTVESGPVEGKQGGAIVGSLVVVRSPDNEVTVIIDRPGKRGVLLVSRDGARKFIAEPNYDYLKSDAVTGKDETAVKINADAGHSIDALVAFSSKALKVLGGDPIAFALAQMETANLGLRNSLVEGVQLNLAGIVVTETDNPVDGAGLGAIQALMTPLRSSYKHDVNVAYSDASPYAGMAYVPGYSSINSIHYPLAFRHEIGHNAGGSHCYPDAVDSYRHGYQTPDGNHTHMCGNNIPYYSTPLVSLNGQPLGDAAKADMARLWREQAGRLSAYSPAFEGHRFVFVSSNILSLTALETGHVEVGIVALTPEVGPTELVSDNPSPNYTFLNVPLRAQDGTEHIVN